MPDAGELELSRRGLLISGAASAAITAVPAAEAQTPALLPQEQPSMMKVSFDVNGQPR